MLIGGFQPFSLSDYPDKIAAIVFSQGCNFQCPFCHNRRLWPRSPQAPPNYSAADIIAFAERRRDKLGGLVITGGEPTLQAALPAFITTLKTVGLSVKLDTNGSRPDILARLLAQNLIDYIAMDIKAPLAKYDLLCGRPVDTGAIRQSITIIAASGVAHHFRTTHVKRLLTTNDLAAVKRLVPPQSKHLVQPCRELSASK